MGTHIRVQTPLLGRHQLRNVALAIAAAVELQRAGLRIGPKDIERGIRQTSWPGRFQVISGEPEIVLDVAHNPAGAWALRSALSQRYGGAADESAIGAVERERRPLLFVFGAMRDKAIAEISEILFPLADRVIATQADNPRSAAPEEVRQLAARTGADILVAPTVAEGLALAQRLADPRTVIVVTGSTYIVGEAMRVLREFCPAP
jgi:dihydrofolate synthase/folylpolyglutamate synthase